MEQKKQLDEQVNQIKSVLNTLNNKEFSIYFFTLDTMGNPTAGIANIYEHVKVLNEMGLHACILHEKNNYKLRGDENGMGIAEWLGKEYAELPHVSIEGQQLNVSPTDFIIIPEIFANIMDQVKSFPCKKIVFSQSYDYLLELLPIGKRWNDYGFNDVITTSDRQAEYLTSLFPIRTHVVPVSIPSYFKPSEKPKLPIVALHTRNQSDAAKIAKAFYLKYPLYKWVSFKELRGLSRQDFAEELGKCCLLVWEDLQAGFGTAPVEAMECDTPVIALIPNMVPEWMVENVDGEEMIKNNGVYTSSSVQIPDLIANYLKAFFEDNVPQTLIDSMESSKGMYTPEKQIAAINDVYNRIIEDRKNELNSILNNLIEDRKNELNSILNNLIEQSK